MLASAIPLLDILHRHKGVAPSRESGKPWTWLPLPMATHSERSCLMCKCFFEQSLWTALVIEPRAKDPKAKPYSWNIKSELPLARALQEVLTGNDVSSRNHWFFLEMTCLPSPSALFKRFLRSTLLIKKLEFSFWCVLDGGAPVKRKSSSTPISHLSKSHCETRFCHNAGTPSCTKGDISRYISTASWTEKFNFQGSKQLGCPTDVR